MALEELKALLSEICKRPIQTPNQARKALSAIMKETYGFPPLPDIRLGTLTKHVLKIYGREDEYDYYLKCKFEIFEFGHIITRNENPVKGEFLNPRKYGLKYIVKKRLLDRIRLPFKDYDMYVTPAGIIIYRHRLGSVFRLKFFRESKRGWLEFRLQFDWFDDIQHFFECLPKPFRDLDKYTIKRHHYMPYIQWVSFEKAKKILNHLKKIKIPYYEIEGLGRKPKVKSFHNGKYSNFKR